MTTHAREALADLARLLGTHLEWQRELGLSSVPRAQPGRRATPRDHEPRPAPARSEAAPTPTPASTHEPAPRPASEPPARVAPDPAVRAALAAAPRVPLPERAPRSLPMLDATLATAAPRAPSAAPFRTPALEGAARLEALEQLRAEVRACTACRLHETRTNTVFARGSATPLVAFVGEGPGRDEDLQGLPFVGAAGQLLDRIIAAMGLGEDELWVGNVVKCRPPNNRVPLPDEMGRCGGFLRKQLDVVRPQVIVTLGKTAAGYLLGTEGSMTKLRGRWHDWYGLPVLPTWHPAYLLRQPEAKRDTWEDMKLVLEKLGRAVPGKGAPKA